MNDIDKAVEEIEQKLLPEIEEAQLKGNTVRITNALTESIRQLLAATKATHDAIDALTVATTKPKAAKAPAKLKNPRTAKSPMAVAGKIKTKAAK